MLLSGWPCWQISPLWPRQLPTFFEDKDHQHILDVHIVGRKMFFNSPFRCRWPPLTQYIWSPSGQRAYEQISWIASAPQTPAAPLFGPVCLHHCHLLCFPTHCPLYSLDTQRSRAAGTFSLWCNMQTLLSQFQPNISVPNQKSCDWNCRFKLTLHSIITLVLTDFFITTGVKIF